MNTEAILAQLRKLQRDLAALRRRVATLEHKDRSEG